MTVKNLLKTTCGRYFWKLCRLEKRIDLLEMATEKRKKTEPFVLMFVGINGTGKTTTIAKVAQFLPGQRLQRSACGADTYRAGSIEQLEEHGKRLGMRVIKSTYGGDPAAVAYDAVSHAKAHGINVVLIDTAGRMQTNQNLMNELIKVKRVVRPDLTIFTVDSLNWQRRGTAGGRIQQSSRHRRNHSNQSGC